MLNLKVHPQCFTSSSQALPPKGSMTSPTATISWGPSVTWSYVGHFTFTIKPPQHICKMISLRQLYRVYWCPSLSDSNHSTKINLIFLTILYYNSHSWKNFIYSMFLISKQPEGLKNENETPPFHLLLKSPLYYERPKLVCIYFKNSLGAIMAVTNDHLVVVVGGLRERG